jgi:hypothetical protein
MGVQFICRNGTLEPDKIENPERVDERRKGIGLQKTLAESLDAIRREQPVACS